MIRHKLAPPRRKERLVNDASESLTTRYELSRHPIIGHVIPKTVAAARNNSPNLDWSAPKSSSGLLLVHGGLGATAGGAGPLWVCGNEKASGAGGLYPSEERGRVVF